MSKHNTRIGGTEALQPPPIEIPEDGAIDPRERWGHGKQPYWNRDRVEAALRHLITASTGPLPAGSREYSNFKVGRPDMPAAASIQRHMLTPAIPTFGHLWLSLDAPRSRVKILGGRWTADEDEYLFTTAGERTLPEIGQRLHRSAAACKRRLYDYGTTARNNQGYMSARQVAGEYGCDVYRVTRLIAEGHLEARLLHGNRYAIDPLEAEGFRDLLTAPPSRGPWPRDEQGRPIAPTRTAAEPEIYTRVPSREVVR